MSFISDCKVLAKLNARYNIIIGIPTKKFRRKPMKTSITVKIICGITAGIMALSLAACNQQKTTESTVSTTEKATEKTTEVAATSTPAPVPVKIKLWRKPGADAAEATLKVYEAFNAKFKAKFPHIEVQDDALKAGTDYRQEYDIALMAGDAPTAIDFLPYVDIPTRIKNHTVADITELYNSWDKKDMIIKTFDEAISTKDGRWYATAHEQYVMGTMYNAKSIRDGGGDPANLPKTWAEFGELGKKLTDVKKPRFGYELVGMDWNAWPFTAWVWSAGGEMVRANDDGTYKLAFNEDPGVDAALFMNEMVWKYQMTQKDVLQDWNKLTEDIFSGRACFSWASVSWIGQEQLEKYGQKIEDYGFMTMPVKDASIKNPAFSGGQVVTYNPKATKEELKAAWDYFDYLFYDEEMLTELWTIKNQYKLADLMVPGIPSLFEKKLSIFTSVPESFKKDLLAATDAAKAEPFCPNWNDLKNDLVKPIQQILLKKNATRDEVKKILDTVAEEIYNKYPTSFKK